MNRRAPRVVQEAFVAAKYLNLPMFSGGSTEEWIAQAEEYFILHGTAETKKI